MKMQTEKILKEIKKLKCDQNTWVGKLKDLENRINNPETPTVPFWAEYQGGLTGRCFKIIGDRHNLDTLKDAEECALDSSCYRRHLTPEEIEAHLIGLFKEKYKYGDRIDGLNGIGDIYLEDNCFDDTWFYADDHDRLSHNYVVIYEKGKWAEIVPSLPSWDKILGGYQCSFHFNVKDSNQADKVQTFRKLLAVADYVNDLHKQTKHKDSFFFELDMGDLMIESYKAEFSCSPYRFNTKEAAQVARDIFKHNVSEDELINFFK